MDWMKAYAWLCNWWELYFDHLWHIDIMQCMIVVIYIANLILHPARRIVDYFL